MTGMPARPGGARTAHELSLEKRQFDPIDIETIRRTCDTVMWGVPGRNKHPDALLIGHVELLLPEVRPLVRRASGSWRRTGQHVLVRTRHTLAAVQSTQPDSSCLWDLAAHCRALLALHQQLGTQADRPADGPADGGRK